MENSNKESKIKWWMRMINDFWKELFLAILIMIFAYVSLYFYGNVVNDDYTMSDKIFVFTIPILLNIPINFFTKNCMDLGKNSAITWGFIPPWSSIVFISNPTEHNFEAIISGM